MRQAFDVDFDVAPAGERKVSQDDVKFTQIVAEGMQQLPDSHFQVPLPFRELPTDLPDSRPLAFRRLMSVAKKMRKDQVFMIQYADFMNTLISSGHAERVAMPDAVPAGERWYWCHHAVKHPRKPNEVRGVWDGRAEVDGVSINSKLLTGPDQMNNLVGVLIRFREEKVAVTCDVEGMFLQVRVEPQHRRYLRFLWFRNGDVDQEIIEYRMTVHPFGAASSPGCAGAALLETAKRGEGRYGERAAQFVKDNFYVDDGLGSEASDEKAIELIKDSRGLCSAGGFNLRKFASSSRAVMEAIPAEWRAKSLQDLDLMQGGLPTECTLGLLMSLEADAFLYCVKLVVRADTRRAYLSALSSVFDPMGLVSPALLPGRRLLQELCKQKFSWDEQVPAEIKEEWQGWHRQLEGLNELKIDRCVRREAGLKIARRELHVFSDASTTGYGACCYLLLANQKGRTDTTLLYAKSRVPPSKQTTVPRLELQAAVLGVKMGMFVQEEMGKEDLACHFWTDSTVVLGYITNEAKRFHVYVANRAQYVRSHTEATQWHHVDTARNPADLASRGVTSAELKSSKLWWQGPRELMMGEHVAIGHTEVDADDPELKKQAFSCSVKVSARVESDVERLLVRSSSWLRCVRVIALCLKFADRLRTQALGLAGPEPMQSVYMSKACSRIVMAEQRVSFAAELDLLSDLGYPSSQQQVKDRKKRLQPTSNLYRLDVYRDAAGVLRVGGRLSLSGWPREVTHPRVLPGDSRLAELLVMHYHVRTEHMGTVTTVNALRQAGWWLLGGRSVVGRHVSRCVTCLKKRGRVVEQKMANLPADRLDPAPPFTHVAVDLFGPWPVKRGRAIEKWWICLFVCMASRAVHLEPVNSLDISGFMQAYRRFVGRRGPIRSLRCDRCTNFVGASNEQASAMKQIDAKQLDAEMAKRLCDVIPFRFNYPKASHMAGAWERMIRTVRSAFWTTLQKHGTSVPLEVFLTLAVEAEGLVNSRPLSVVDMVDDTTPSALTPAQLLTMKPDVLLPPPGEFDENDRYSRKRWKLTQHLADQFWRRWVSEYALKQQRREKWQNTRDNLQIDDVVMLVEDTAARGRWPLAIVTEVERSEDGLVRKLTVRTAAATLQRPVQKVVFLYRQPKSLAED